MSEDIGPENFCHRRLLLYAGFVSTKIPMHIKKYVKQETKMQDKISSHVTSCDGLPQYPRATPRPHPLTAEDMMCNTR